MFVCVCVCVYIHTYTHTYIHTYIGLHTLKHTDRQGPYPPGGGVCGVGGGQVAP